MSSRCSSGSDGLSFRGVAPRTAAMTGGPAIAATESFKDAMTEIDDLAEALYPLIVPHARRRNGSISYSDLCAGLTGRWAGLDPRSTLLAQALGAIVRRCRVAKLPALSALVVHAGSDKRPGTGYYEAAHPGIDDPMAREVAWAKEFDAAHKATYPAKYANL
jgi:hypothetical protein